MAQTTGVISFDEFLKLDIRVARVIECRDHPNADKLLVLKVDLGTQERQLCAGIRGYYQPDELVGKNIVMVANLAPRQMRGEMSQGMLLAATSENRDQVVLLTTAADIAPGSRVC
jgi:methionine--tRNA ligase beta chain